LISDYKKVRVGGRNIGGGRGLGPLPIVLIQRCSESTRGGCKIEVVGKEAVDWRKKNKRALSKKEEGMKKQKTDEERRDPDWFNGLKKGEDEFAIKATTHTHTLVE